MKNELIYKKKNTGSFLCLSQMGSFFSEDPLAVCLLDKQGDCHVI